MEPVDALCLSTLRFIGVRVARRVDDARCLSTERPSGLPVARRVDQALTADLNTTPASRAASTSTLYVSVQVILPDTRR